MTEVDIATSRIDADILASGHVRKIQALPLSRNNRNVPIKGEQVQCFIMPTGGTIHASTPYGWFYSSIFSRLNSETHNTDASHPNYVGGQKVYARTFDINKKYDYPTPEEGEIALLGRFGNWVRLTQNGTELVHGTGKIHLTNAFSETKKVPTGFTPTRSNKPTIALNSNKAYVTADETVIYGKLGVVSKKWTTEIDVILDLLDDIVTELSNLTSGISTFVCTTPAGPGNTTTATNAAKMQFMKTKLKLLKS